MTKRAKKLLTNVAVLLVGVIMIVVSSILIAQDKKVTYLETEATIVAITENVEYDDEGAHTEHTVYVDYTVDGKEYKDVKLGSYDASMDEGETVTIKYNVDDPSEIKAPGTDLMRWIFIGFGALLIIFSLLGTAKTVIRGR